MSETNQQTSEELARVLEAEVAGTKRRRILTWLVVLVAVVALAAYVLLRSGDDGSDVSYVTALVKRGNLTLRVTATGELEPLNQVDVGTEVSGTIETINVDHNDRVVAGQVLAMLDTDQLDAKFRQSKAALALADAQVLEAEATVVETANRLKRTQGLIARKLSSQDELDQATAAAARAKAALAVAKAQVDQANAQLDADRQALEKATIKSPIDGVVLDRQVETGQTVAATLQTPILFTLAEDLAAMELHINVDEADVGQVREGQPAEFTVDAYPDRRFPARIEQVRYAPQNIDGVVTYEALLSVDNSDLLLRPGMTATAEIIAAQYEDVILVPTAAFRFDAVPATLGSESRSDAFSRITARFGKPQEVDPVPVVSLPEGPHVWVLKDGRPEPIAVTTGPSDGEFTQIVDGPIEAGMAVIVNRVEQRS